MTWFSKTHDHNDFKQFFFHLAVWLENHADKNSTQTIMAQETCKVCWYHCKLVVKYSLIYSENISSIK